jgi:hypothetical protein
LSFDEVRLVAAVARWTDFRGRLVELTDEGLAHIETNHPEFSEPIARIEGTLTDPMRVMRDARIGRAECYYRTIGGRLMVKAVVLFRPTPSGWVGEVLTAHPTGRDGRGEQQLWP